MNCVVDLGEVLQKRRSFILCLLLVGCGWIVESNKDLIRNKRLKSKISLKRRVS